MGLLCEHRAREGAELKAGIESRLDTITSIISDISTALPGILAAQQNKLKEQISELEIEVDAGRLEQELVIIMQKADIEEEIDRLASPCKGNPPRHVSLRADWQAT